MDSQIVIALYRPHAGQADALAELARRHLPLLRTLGLVTDRPGVLCRAGDGTLLEIFEWASADGSARAHDEPEVARLWEAMGAIADFPNLADLPEAGQRFPHFAPL
jgi:hypothetical protein